MKRPYAAFTGDIWHPRHFETFLAAETWAKARVRSLDARGFAHRATITHPDYGHAEVRLDGCDRAWTDMTNWSGPT